MDLVTRWFNNVKKDEKSVTLLMIKGYFLLILLCFIFLILPFSQHQGTSLVNHIFFAVSIVSTTGLAPDDFASTYSVFGQAISLFFIQLGGIGYMALSSFIVLKKFSRLPILSVRLLRLEFNLPQKYPLLQFIYSIFVFTIAIEVIGTGLLYIGFKEEGIDYPLWHAMFHSISAFCTAGFSLFSDSMTSFKDNTLITSTILCLSLLGSIGFIVLLDFWNKLISKRNTITLTSKIILFGTVIFGIVSSLLIYFSESSLQHQGWGGFKTALFQSISAHTTVGFNNYDLGSFSMATTFVMILIMIIGASPSGTGGGIKTTTITALFAVLKSILKRKKHITFFKKKIPDSNIYLAIATTIFYTIVLLVGAWLVLLVDGERFSLGAILFEISSALSTVGLSTGITADFSATSKIIIAILMFIGRIGVLTFGFALITKAPLLRNAPKTEDIAL